MFVGVGVGVFFLGSGVPLSGALSPHSRRAPLRCPSPTAPTARYCRATKAPSGLIRSSNQIRK